MLDEDFSWTDRSGKTPRKNELLTELKTVASEPDVDRRREIMGDGGDARESPDRVSEC